MMNPPSFSGMRQPQPKAPFKPNLSGGQKPAARFSPQFSGGVNGGVTSGYRKLLNQLDFREMGTSYVNQIKIVYAACIAWRLVAANERRKSSPLKSWNEVRENALRDSMGYMFWFFATPLLQRGILAYFTKKNPEIGHSLYQMDAEVAKGKGLMGQLKKWNPLYSVNIPSSEQVNNQKELALHHLKKANIEVTDAAYKATEAFYKKIFMYRNIATGLGLINTIALIGIGINLLNFHLTRKNMEFRKTAMQRPSFPEAPPLPKLPTSVATSTPPQPQYSGSPMIQLPPQNPGRLA